MQSKDHWDNFYSTKATTAVSWFQQHADLSFDIIRATGVACDAAIIDVGGGASVLVDDLLDHGYTNLTVLDLCAAALAAAQKRLGSRASQVKWIEVDITKANLPARQLDVWHDRAVFNFLTSPEDRDAYVRTVFNSVKPGGHVFVATFSEDGPEKCSDLPVMRYSADGLLAQFGYSFTLLNHSKETHHTPSGKVQQFVYCYFRKIDS
jgi:2-polyprenyl-3-methyl-5-hydroxy-6-metoxy-1,4-benzoquinol methylase